MKTMTLIALLLFSFSVQAGEDVPAAKFDSCAAAAQSAVIAQGAPREQFPAMAETIEELVTDETVRKAYDLER